MTARDRQLTHPMRLDVFSCRRLSTEPPTHSRYDTAQFHYDTRSDIQPDRQTDRQVRQKNGQTDRHTTRQIDRQTDGQRDRQTDRWDRETARQKMDRQTYNQTDRQTDRRMDSVTYTHLMYTTAKPWHIKAELIDWVRFNVPPNTL